MLKIHQVNQRVPLLSGPSNLCTYSLFQNSLKFLVIRCKKSVMSKIGSKLYGWNGGAQQDRSIPLRLEGWFYQTAIWPIFLYDMKCCIIKRHYTQKTSLAEIHMLHRLCDNIRWDKVRDKVLLLTVSRHSSIEEKMPENYLGWFGHVQCWPINSLVRGVHQQRAS